MGVVRLGISYPYAELVLHSKAESVMTGSLDSVIYSAAQRACMQQVCIDVDCLLGPDDDTFKAPVWSALLARRKLSYNGKVVVKAKDVTFEQVEPALPSKGVAGSIFA